MVYRGKLSKACAECRAKRTKCDEAKPACSQCLRANRRCSGYRNIEGVRILDESQTIKQKSKPGQSQDSLSLIIPSRSRQIEFEGSCVFFREFSKEATGYVKTDFDFISQIRHDAKSDGMLVDMITSIGVLTLSLKHGDPSLRRTADKFYARALHRSSRALSDVEMAKSDEMLSTVWLLTIHELISDDSQHYARPHSMHLDGAARLIMLRGLAQFDTYVGRSMLSILMFNIVLDCLARRVEVPSELLQLINQGLAHCHQELRLGFDIIFLSARLCNLVVNQSDCNIEESLCELWRIDQAMVDWTASLTPLVHYSLTSIKPALPIEYQHVFQNHAAASLWNHYYATRILVNVGIQNLIQRVENICQKPARESKQATDLRLRELSHQLCRNIPFFLDYNGNMTMYGAISSLPPVMLAIHGQWASPPVLEWMTTQLLRIVTKTNLDSQFIARKAACVLGIFSKFDSRDLPDSGL